MRARRTFARAAEQLDLFMGVGGDIAARDAQDLMAWDAAFRSASLAR